MIGLEGPKTKGTPTIFISYAHESDALRAAVKALADWLGERGCIVHTDHLHAYRPPPDGWRTWMEQCIERADDVLVVCTPKLKARFEKTAPPVSGFGATFEGAIVTQHIYDNAMRNTKFFPIAPDGGSHGDVPTKLRDWWNGHYFPTGNEGILRMIFDGSGNDGASGPPGGGPMKPSGPQGPENGPLVNFQARLTVGKLLDLQVRLAVRRLTADAAWPYFQTLCQELTDEFPDTKAPTTPPEAVNLFAHCDAGNVQFLFFVVRRALKAVAETDPREISARRAAEEAAVALYIVAASRLVDQAARTARGYVLPEPVVEPLIAAVIANALFGGELRLLPSEHDNRPHPDAVFVVHVAAGQDQPDDFERAVYVALREGYHDQTEASLGSGPLTSQQREWLGARLRTIRHVQRKTLVLVVHGLVPIDQAEHFATDHEVPILGPAIALPDSNTTTVLVGMTHDRLLSEINAFWSELHVLRATGPQSADPPPSPSGTRTMPDPSVHISVSGDKATVAVTTGNGSHATAHAVHHGGLDPAALQGVLTELIQAISANPEAKALAPQAKAAKEEAGKGSGANLGVIKTAVDAIKLIAGGLDSGEKIVAACEKAYTYFSP